MCMPILRDLPHNELWTGEVPQQISCPSFIFYLCSIFCVLLGIERACQKIMSAFESVYFNPMQTAEEFPCLGKSLRRARSA